MKLHALLAGLAVFLAAAWLSAPALEAGSMPTSSTPSQGNFLLDWKSWTDFELKQDAEESDSENVVVSGMDNDGDQDDQLAVTHIDFDTAFQPEGHYFGGERTTVLYFWPESFASQDVVHAQLTTSKELQAASQDRADFVRIRKDSDEEIWNHFQPARGCGPSIIVFSKEGRIIDQQRQVSSSKILSALRRAEAQSKADANVIDSNFSKYEKALEKENDRAANKALLNIVELYRVYPAMLDHYETVGKAISLLGERCGATCAEALSIYKSDDVDSDDRIKTLKSLALDVKGTCAQDAIGELADKLQDRARANK